MANKLEEFYHETIDKILKEVPLEKRREGVSRRIAQGLPPDKHAELVRHIKGNGNKSKPE